MPPPAHMPNILRVEGRLTRITNASRSIINTLAGDYEVTSTVHSDTYESISPSNVNLHGVAAFITGGSRGLGEAAAISLAKAGASYIAVGARSNVEQVGIRVKEAARLAGRPEPEYLGVQLDVTDLDSVSEAAATVEKIFGQLQVLVNNAGVLGKYGLIADSNPTEWLQVMKVNLEGPYLVSRAFLPLMLKSTGSKYIINMISGGAFLTNPTLSAYQVSKGALLKLTTLLNAEYASKGVVSFGVHPGNCPTDIMGGPANIPDHHKHVFVDTPELSADSIAFLVSQRRDWIGGRYINCTWDLPELLAKEREIVEGNKLRTRLVY